MRGTWREESGARPPWRETLAGLRRSVLAFSTDQPGRLLQVFLLDLSFHALAVFEIFLTLRWLLGDRSPTLAQAIVFEALNRVVTVAFKFVPFRVGIDEALSGGLAPVMAIQPGGRRDARRRAEGQESGLDGDRLVVYRRASCSR